MEIRERRTYTTFAEDDSSVAGTLEKMGPFAVCTLVFQNIRAFRNFVAQRPQADLPALAQAYHEQRRTIQQENEARSIRRREYAAQMQHREQAQKAVQCRRF